MDEKIWLETTSGEKLFMYKTEKCDMQKELNTQIIKLNEKISKAIGHINACGKELSREQREYLLSILEEE